MNDKLAPHFLEIYNIVIERFKSLYAADAHKEEKQLYVKATYHLDRAQELLSLLEKAFQEEEQRREELIKEQMESERIKDEMERQRLQAIVDQIQRFKQQKGDE